MTGCAAAADGRLKAGQGVRVARSWLTVRVPLPFLLKFSNVSSVIINDANKGRRTWTEADQGSNPDTIPTHQVILNKTSNFSVCFLLCNEGLLMPILWVVTNSIWDAFRMWLINNVTMPCCYWHYVWMRSDFVNIFILLIFQLNAFDQFSSQHNWIFSLWKSHLIKSIPQMSQYELIFI